MSVQALVTADNHLDPTAAGFSYRRYDRRRDHLLCFEEVMKYAEQNRPDILLVAGDLFDSVRPSNHSRARLMQDFKSLSEKGIKIFLVSGHHDTPKSVEEGVSPLAVYGNSGYAVFFQNPSEPTKAKMKIGQLELSVLGLSYNPLLQARQDPLTGLDLRAEGDIRIFVTHYPIEGFSGCAADEAVIKLSSFPQDFQLITAGHIHRYQKKQLGDAVILIPGSTERTSFQEEDDEKGFVWLEILKKGVSSIEHIRTPARRYKTLTVEWPIQGDTLEVLKKIVEEYSDLDSVLRLRLRGKVTTEQLAGYRRADLLAYAENKYFHFSVDDGELVIESPEPLEALPLTTPLEELRRYFASLMENSSEEEVRILRDALNLAEAKLKEAGAW
ncbi:exonuclease SbcCD subunit D [Candidatus Bathyarchaeota archaeon]|nr:exonuclease SbcCD subunit D [Candidatus Bathyarchaeota archaeon]